MKAHILFIPKDHPSSAHKSFLTLVFPLTSVSKGENNEELSKRRKGGEKEKCNFILLFRLRFY